MSSARINGGPPRAPAQARNNARAVFTGSLYMLSDSAFGAHVAPASGGGAGPSGNRALAAALSAWAFQETGVLRASRPRHSRADGSPAETMLARGGGAPPAAAAAAAFSEPEVAPASAVYRVRDALAFEVDIEEAVGGRWGPYAADDVQLECVLLEPRARVNMTHDGRGTFRATLALPDTPGIYTLRVAYRRPGLSTLAVAAQVSVAPLRHDAHPRFIPGAVPYYAAAGSLMAGWFFFAMFWHFSRGGGGGA